jgi:uncharacterized protein YndB with AHSA1/START domain
MATITGEITIDRPVEEVFDAVADERNEPKYNPAMISSEKLTDGPIGRGTRFRAFHSSRRGPVEMDVELTDFERPRRLESVTSMSWANVRGGPTFRPTDDGGARMQWSWQVRPRGFARGLGPLVGVIGRRSERSYWEGLKGYLEAGRDPG